MPAEHRTLRVTLHGYWHAGTGYGEAAGADALVARDHEELPVLEGSHLRGLMRHALRQYTDFAQVDGNVVELLFGSPTKRQGEAKQHDTGLRFTSKAGTLFVHDARVPERWRKALIPSPRGELDLRPQLFRTLQSTQIDPTTGTVADRTLRSIEVTVPLVLEAPVVFEGAAIDHLDTLRAALPLIRAVGGRRTRGLGRARLELLEA